MPGRDASARAHGPSAEVPHIRVCAARLGPMWRICLFALLVIDDAPISVNAVAIVMIIACSERRNHDGDDDKTDRTRTAHDLIPFLYLRMDLDREEPFQGDFFGPFQIQRHVFFCYLDLFGA